MGAHFAPPPPAAITRVLGRFDRDQLAGFIAVAIDLLDVADGDTDVEPNGDELDGTGAEDDFYPHSNWLGQPGCPIADPDCCRAADDTGTDHTARRKIGFDGAAGLVDDDAEDTHDREQTNEDGSDAVYRTLPCYGLDQSTGPVNEREVTTTHAVAELGLVRSPTGGWRLPL